MRISTLRLVALFGVAFHSLAPTQAPSPAVMPEAPVTFQAMRALFLEIESRVAAARERGNRLTELDTLRGLETAFSTKGPAARLAVANWMLSVAPELGHYREALRYADLIRRHEPPDSSPPGDMAGFEPVDAVRALVGSAETAQVMMVNEAHHVPQHRAFTITLLKALRERGFTHFAAETLYEADRGLGKRGYPTSATGYYTGEPVYGEMIRTALRLGYKVVAYEPATIINADQRERDQARNLISRVLQANPKARLLVHAGYSHIDESGSKTGAVSMAQRFKELGGIDPLTIDQTVMSERSEVELEHQLYRAAVTNGLLAPSVFQNREGRTWSLDKATHDAMVFHPRSVYVQGRPTWLRLDGSRAPYLLSKDACKPATRCLVRARLASESQDAVPVDQLEVRSEDPVALMLPEGEFILETEDSQGLRIGARRMKTERGSIRPLHERLPLVLVTLFPWALGGERRRETPILRSPRVTANYLAGAVRAASSSSDHAEAGP